MAMGVPMTKLTEDFLRSFSLPQVALLHTLAMEMETYGLTASEVIDICVERLEAERSANPPESHNPQNNKSRKKRRPRLSSVPCPQCGEMLEITPVNVSRCTNIGGPWKSSLLCSSPQCRFTELSVKTVTEWSGKHGL